MFSGGSDIDKQAETFGLPADIIALSEGHNNKDADIYPDNANTVAIFSDMLTQWRVGPSGAVGLVYEALPAVFKFRGIKKKQKPEVFDGVQIMERAALEKMREDK